MPNIGKIGIFFRSTLLLKLWLIWAWFFQGRYFNRGGHRGGNTWILNNLQFKKILKMFKLEKEKPNSPSVSLARVNTGESMSTEHYEPVKTFCLFIMNNKKRLFTLEI